MNLVQRFRFSSVDSNRLIHGLKTAVALLIGIIIVRVFHLPLQGLWVLLSVLIVMCAQSRVGAIVQKSYMRFLGSLVGACVAALTLYLAYPSVLWTTLILCLTTALFSYVSDSPSYLSEAGPVGAITVVVILAGQAPSYTTALDRFTEISVGILIALFVSRFVWPLHSRTQLRYLLKNTLEDLKTLSEQLSTWGSREAERTYEAYDDKLMRRFADQNKLYAEVRHESLDRCSNLTQLFKRILRGERAILGYMNLMRQALTHFPEKASIHLNRQAHVRKMYEVSQQVFQSTIDQFNANKSKRMHECSYNYNFVQWKEDIQQEFAPLLNNTADRLAVDLFIFAAHQLLAQLQEMRTLLIKV